MTGPSPRRRAISVPVRLTYLRIVLVPVVMAFLLLEGTVPGARALAATLFAVAAITDFLDGYLARRWRITTTIGSFLDTTADKLLVAGALIALLAVDRVNVWIAFVIIGRELTLMALRGLAAVDRIVVSASIWGKLKATVQFVAIFMAILRAPFRVGPWYPDEWVMLAAAVITVVSGAEYFKRIWPVLRDQSPAA